MCATVQHVSIHGRTCAFDHYFSNSCCKDIPISKYINVNIHGRTCAFDDNFLSQQLLQGHLQKKPQQPASNGSDNGRTTPRETPHQTPRSNMPDDSMFFDDIPTSVPLAPSSFGNSASAVSRPPPAPSSNIPANMQGYTMQQSSGAPPPPLPPDAGRASSSSRSNAPGLGNSNLAELGRFLSPNKTVAGAKRK